jgi:DNA anti-recombination protein RmuC
MSSSHQSLLHLLDRKGLEGKWNAEREEVHEAIFIATDFDGAKTRILIGIPEVLKYVQGQLEAFPLEQRTLRQEATRRTEPLREDLKALRAAEGSSPDTIAEKEQQLREMQEALSHDLKQHRQAFREGLKTRLNFIARNEMVATARGWQDRIDPDIRMYQSGAGIQDEGRGGSAIRGSMPRSR